MSDIVLSGIRATGRMHFGNFLGAVQQFVKYQSDPSNTCMYFVADYHTLTTLDDPELLRSNLIEMVKDYLAAGLDPENSILYVQSSIPELAELSLYLTMLARLNSDVMSIGPIDELVQEFGERFTLGMATYPVLMAADILGPMATLIPVGADQAQNVELAQKLARKFNNRYGETFVVPSKSINPTVPGLDGKKMGKSNEASSVKMTDTHVELTQKYAKARTMSRPQFGPGDSKQCAAVYPLHHMVTPNESDTLAIARQCQNVGEISCSQCKGILVESVWSVLESFQEQRAKLSSEDDYVRELLIEGGKKARSIIAPKVAEVADKMGIIRYE